MTHPSHQILNPATRDYAEFDEATRSQLRGVIDWFEARGKAS